jgi:predicted ArsR family transcriptional regulator
LTEREDPLAFVLRSRPARETLERLAAEPLMVALDLRKTLGMHPEAFRRMIADLDEFALVSVTVPPTSPRSAGRPMLSLQRRVNLGLTPRGEGLLRVARSVRRLVQRQIRQLPPKSRTYWGSSRPMRRAGADRPQS